MDTDKMIQHYVLEELNNQLERHNRGDIVEGKPAKSTLHISQLEEKLNFKYNVTQIRTNYIRLMDRDFVMKIDVLKEMSNLRISNPGVLAYASLILVNENNESIKLAKPKKTEIFDYIYKSIIAIIAIITITWNIYSSKSNQLYREQLNLSIDSSKQVLNNLDLKYRNNTEAIEQLRKELVHQAKNDTSSK